MSEAVKASPEAAPTTARPRLLFVANKRLPAADHRMVYARRSSKAEVLLMLPEMPEDSRQIRYVHGNFREGLAFADILAFLRLFAYLRRERGNLDLVHFFSTKLILIGPCIARAAGVRSVTTVTGLGRVFDDGGLRYRPLRFLYNLLMRQSIGKTERVLFQNRGHLEAFKRKHPRAAAKLNYVGSCIAPPVDDATTPPDFDAPRLRVLHVARLLPAKGIEDFLAVAERCSGPFEFVLIGPAAAGQEHLLERVTEADRTGIVRYLGEVQDLKLWEEYRRSHIFLFPSHGEGLPRVMLEAGIAGLCPVAYDIPANRDLIPPGAGFLVPLRATDELVECLQRLARHRSSARESARIYERVVRERFGPDGFAARCDRIYKEILAAGEQANHEG